MPNIIGLKPLKNISPNSTLPNAILLNETPVEYATRWFRESGCTIVEPSPYQKDDVPLISIQRPYSKRTEIVIINSYIEKESRKKELTERQFEVVIAATFTDQDVSVFTVEKVNGLWEQYEYLPYIETLHRPMDRS